MAVKSFVMIRMQGDRDTATNPETPAGPRTSDLEPYRPYSWVDITARCKGYKDSNYWDVFESDPQLMIIRILLTNDNAIAMREDPMLWMILSFRYNAAGEIVETDKDVPYTEEERTLRIDQLATTTGINKAKLESLWTYESTHLEVADMLRAYLRRMK